jgi:hypothetical protein
MTYNKKLHLFSILVVLCFFAVSWIDVRIQKMQKVLTCKEMKGSNVKHVVRSMSENQPSHKQSYNQSNNDT